MYIPGRLRPSRAAALAPLLNLQMRAVERTDLERRVAKMEKLLPAANEGERPDDSVDSER